MGKKDHNHPPHLAPMGAIRANRNMRTSVAAAIWGKDNSSVHRKKGEWTSASLLFFVSVTDSIKCSASQVQILSRCHPQSWVVSVRLTELLGSELSPSRVWPMVDSREPTELLCFWLQKPSTYFKMLVFRTPRSNFWKLNISSGSCCGPEGLRYCYNKLDLVAS